MRRYTLLVWGSIALSALSLVPVLLGQATAADKPASAPAEAKQTKATPATVPEDGSGADDFPASSRLVRDILQTRASEDLIICVAGCRPGNDRVVYSQPSDPKAVPAPAVAATQPAPEQPQPVAAEQPSETPSPEATAEPANTEKVESQPEGAAPSSETAGTPSPESAGDPDPAAAQAGPDGTGEGRMEPTAAEPGQPDGNTPPAEEIPSEWREGEPVPADPEAQ
jgi:hypothetical protein